MLAPSPLTWKLALAILLGLVIIIGRIGNPPRADTSSGELRLLLLASLALYAVGVVAYFTHRQLLAVVVYSAGIVVCAVAVWLSRGQGPDLPPEDEDPGADRPGPGPAGLPEPWGPRGEWAAFEAQFRDHDRGQQRERLSGDRTSSLPAVGVGGESRPQRGRRASLLA